jgi:hypothetical protein
VAKSLRVGRLAPRGRDLTQLLEFDTGPVGVTTALQIRDEEPRCVAVTQM